MRALIIALTLEPSLLSLAAPATALSVKSFGNAFLNHQS
jgi:hypothetical protein